MMWKSDSAVILLHRGACLVAPENTAPALEEAVRQGADGVEIDVRRTQDGALVLYHDDWLLQQRGTAGKLEEWTLAATQRLDASARFGPRWKGLHPPLFEDVLRFAKANALRLVLDIKTPGIYEEALRLTETMGCLPLVHTTGGYAPPDRVRASIPSHGGWNYTNGGEEDLERMRAVLAQAPAGNYTLMAEDARCLARLLGRCPEKRPFVPFVSTMAEKQSALRPVRKRRLLRSSARASLQSEEAEVRRAACIALSRRPQSATFDRLVEMAASDPDAVVRQEACWALGSLRDTRASETLARLACTPRDADQEEAGDYRTVFLKIAAACALARLDSVQARAFLETLAHASIAADRLAAAFGLAAFGTDQDILRLAALVSSVPAGETVTARIVLDYAGRFGAQAIPIYLAALGHAELAKYGVFGLARIGKRARSVLQAALAAPALEEMVRYRAALALAWMASNGARPMAWVRFPELPKSLNPERRLHAAPSPNAEARADRLPGE